MLGPLTSIEQRRDPEFSVGNLELGQHTLLRTELYTEVLTPVPQNVTISGDEEGIHRVWTLSQACPC